MIFYMAQGGVVEAVAVVENTEADLRLYWVAAVAGALAGAAGEAVRTVGAAEAVGILVDSAVICMPQDAQGHI